MVEQRFATEGSTKRPRAKRPADWERWYKVAEIQMLRSFQMLRTFVTKSYQVLTDPKNCFQFSDICFTPSLFSRPNSFGGRSTKTPTASPSNVRRRSRASRRCTGKSVGPIRNSFSSNPNRRTPLSGNCCTLSTEKICFRILSSFWPTTANSLLIRSLNCRPIPILLCSSLFKMNIYRYFTHSIHSLNLYLSINLRLFSVSSLSVK